jgi:hypothetical protein
MFVTRLSPDGSQITYSTYLGGPSADVLEDLAVDATGGVVVAGWVTGNTVQTFVSTPGTFDSTWNGSQDCALARLALDGAGTADLRYATLIGGSNQDNFVGVAIDPVKPALVTAVGDSWSEDFPTTPGVVKATNPRFSDLFESQSGLVVRFELPPAGGGTRLWSSYFVTPARPASGSPTSRSPLPASRSSSVSRPSATSRLSAAPSIARSPAPVTAPTPSSPG